MPTKQTPHDAMNEALYLARSNGMYVVPREDNGEQVHILYRRLPGRASGERLGKCRSAAALLRKVKKCAGSAR